MPIRPKRRHALYCAAVAAAAIACVAVATTNTSSAVVPKPKTAAAATTPIQHLVVIFDENVSFDHYFGTYPNATGTDGTKFTPTAAAPKVNTLASAGLLKNNPNEYQPKRLGPAQAVTCDQNHNYTPEQNAFDDGLMDKFVQNVSVDTCSGAYGAPGLSMDYYDGNTVTGLWNYAQQYAMSDNSFDTTFGPSSPGAINLISGQTHGFQAVTSVTHQPTTDSYAVVSPNLNGVGTVTNDPDPAYDDCSDSNHTSTNNLAAAVPGQQNIGDLLNSKNVTWGWFQGGFAPTTPAGGGNQFAVCGATHDNVAGASVADYSAHHNPFQFYASTANPHHLPPSSIKAIGTTDQANHQYDISDFDATLAAGNLPSVSFLKAPEYEDGHASYSDPIDEQNFLVKEINALQKSKFWSSTAVVIAYDDSDGWYDHVASPITNSSHTSIDAAICTSSNAPVLASDDDRCGPGPRLPLLVISPYAKADFVDHTPTTQASILKFIETNWSTGSIGNGSFDQQAGSLDNMLSFTSPGQRQMILNPNGTIASLRLTPVG